MIILYLIDPNSIHDQKWIAKFAQDSKKKCFFICRENHYNKEFIERFENDFNIKFVGTVDYFSFIRIGHSIKQLLGIKKIFKEQNIQLFHIQYAEPNALWVLFRAYLGIPMVITCRGTDVLKTIPSHFAKKDFFNRLISWAYKRAFVNADWITVTSQSQLEAVKKFSGRSDKISIIRTGVNLKQIKADTSAHFPKEINKPYILFPRYIKPIYNHEFAIEALKKLSLDLKQKYQMVFVGKDSGDVEYQNQLIQILKKDSEIDFLFLEKQQQKVIWELYKKADLIMMTPRSDGSPVSGMEAIALGKKLILGPLNYDQDIFNFSTCYKLKNWDTEELKDLIESLLNIEKTNKIDDLSIIDFDANMEKVNSIYTNLENSY